MGKILIYIIGAYCVYYAFNIVYDMFLAKEKVPKQNDDGETISLGEITENDYAAVKNVAVEDVETVNFPTSFDADEEEIFSSSNGEEIPLESLKIQYEEESLIEQESKETEDFKNQQVDFIEAKSSIKSVLALKTQNIISEAKQIISNNTTELDNWESFMDRATANVVLTSNNDGHKVFKST